MIENLIHGVLNFFVGVIRCWVAWCLNAEKQNGGMRNHSAILWYCVGLLAASLWGYSGLIT